MKEIKRFFRRRYRIVTDEYLGFEVQSIVWYFPFWAQCGYTNTHTSIEDAKEYIEKIKKKVVYVEKI